MTTSTERLARLTAQLDHTVDKLDSLNLDARRRQCHGVAQTLAGAADDKVCATLARQWVQL